jgi:hypothetical protein
MSDQQVHLKLALMVLLNGEELETKLNILTEISIQTGCEETLLACEQLRGFLCDEINENKIMP